MVSYLNKFSGHLAELSAPTYVYVPSGSESEWCWGSDQQTFEKIRTEFLTCVLVLHALDVSMSHIGSADASANAIVAVLLQFKMIIFGS